MNIDQLKEFCAPQGSKHKTLRNPHTSCGVTIASNTFIVVRIPAITNGKPVRKYPKLKKTINQVAEKAKSLKPIEMPDFAIPKMKNCADCYGRGLSSSHNGLCDRCEGVGKIERVISRTSKTRLISVGDAYFNPYLLMLIYKLPGIKIFPNGAELPAYFIFYGGDGVIMPYRYLHSNKLVNS